MKPIMRTLRPIKNNDNDTLKDPSIFSAGAILAVQQKDMGPWMHEVMVEVKGSNHREHSYNIWFMKDRQAHYTHYKT